jgi:hypothetical protein
MLGFAQPPLADVSGAATNDGAQVIQWTPTAGHPVAA